MQSMYDALYNDLDLYIRNRGSNIKELRVLIDSAFGQAKERLILLGQKSYRLGLEDSGIQPWEARSDLADNKINDHISNYIDKLRRDVINGIEKNLVKSKELNNVNAIFVSLVLDSLRHRAAMIDNSEIMRSYNYGKASGFRVNGFDMIASRRNGTGDCSICDDHTLKYKNTDVIIFEDLPPLHPHCTCTMEREA
jgi:hypothetical protein